MSSACVLVTGANGFLGSHLLGALQRQGVRSLRVLVRPSELVSARQRLISACNHLHLSINLEDVEVIPGDLSQPELGLSAQDRKRLVAGVDVVLHGGAQVNFFSSPELLHHTNVEGTAQLLGLAAAAGVRRFVLLSSLAVCNGFTWPEQKPIPEQPIRVEPSRPFSPYARSKLAAEQLCLSCSAAGIAMAVLRIPYLMGSQQMVSLNPHGYLDVVLRAALRLGHCFDDDFNFHALPVDICADWVVRLALAEVLPEQVVHVLANSQLRWSDWLEDAEAAGLAMELEPMAPWFARLRDAAAANHDPQLLAAFAFLSLEPSHRRWMQVPSHRLIFANDNLCAQVPEAGCTELLCLNLRKELLQQLVASGPRVVEA